MIFIIDIYLDGGLKNNIMYISILSTSSELPIKFSKKLGDGLSHIAEEKAFDYCIDLISSLDTSLLKNIRLYSDHISLVNMLNSTNLSNKAIKTYPTIEKVKNFITENNIQICWIKGTKNLAHRLIDDCYNGVFYKEVPYKLPSKNISQNIIPSKTITEDNSTIKPSTSTCNTPYDLTILKLQCELKKKDLLIKDLLKIINKLNIASI